MGYSSENDSRTTTRRKLRDFPGEWVPSTFSRDPSKNLENMMQTMMDMMQKIPSHHLGSHKSPFVNMNGVLSPLQLSQGDSGNITPLALDAAPPILAPPDNFVSLMSDFGKDRNDSRQMEQAQHILKLQNRIAAIQLVPSVSIQSDEEEMDSTLAL